MLKNWILVLTLAGLAYAAPAVVAQDAPSSDQQAAPTATPPEHGGREGHGGRFDPERRADMLTKRLNLSADQKAKVTDIFKSEQEQMQKTHADTSASQQDRRAKMMDMRKASNDQIRAVLNPDQQKKWDEMQAQREQWVKGRHEPPPTTAAPPDNNQK